MLWWSKTEQKVWSNELYLQSFTLDDMYVDHAAKLKQVLKKENSEEHMVPYDGCVVDEDRRLALFGWTVENINLLILPMIRSQ